MSKPLFDDDSDSDNAIQLETNKEFAKTYNKYRQKELLKKLKDKEAGNDSDSSSESESSEDDDVAHDPKFDEEFYKTLSSLKQRDPKIYDKNVKFFESVNNDETADDTENENEEKEKAQITKKIKKEKALTVKDYERKMLLVTGGIYEDDEENQGERPQSPSYAEEQKLIKGEFKKIIKSEDSDSDTENNWGGIFKKREKTREEQAKEDEEHKEWQGSKEGTEYMKPLKEYWSNPKLSSEEVFLRDYILSNAYAEHNDDEIPTYDEIIGKCAEEQDFEEKQTEFEHKYNFRFEEPDQEFIKRYPRTIDHSLRKTDDRRKIKRVEVKERKEKEKQEKFREIEMLKGLKRKEISDKISKLKVVTGTDDLQLNDNDLEGDFDPEEHDKRMAELFNNEYYQFDEGEEKPECPSDIEELQVENYDDYNPHGNDNDDNDDDELPHCEDEDFNMDCEYEETTNEVGKKSLLEEMIENTMNKRKRRKRKSKFMEMLESRRPVFNPEDHKSYAEYLDEYYKLDCEDIVGDVKCRFKYVETTPNDFGLSVEEILLAKNKELNQWASMKKATQIRPEHVEKNEQMIFHKKARNQALKMKILRSLYEESSDDETEVTETVNILKPFTMENDDTSNKEQKPTDTSQNEKKKGKMTAKIVSGNDKEVNSEKQENIIFKQETPSNQTSTSVNHKVEKSDSSANKWIISENVSSSSRPSKTQSNLHSLSASSDNRSKPKPKVNFVKLNSSTSQLNTKPNSVKNKAMINFNKKHNEKFRKVQSKSIDKAKAQKAIGLSDERLKAFGINPKKFHKKLKYAPNSQSQQQQKSGAKNSNKIKKNSNQNKASVAFRPPAKIPQNKSKNNLYKNKLKKALNKS